MTKNYLAVERHGVCVDHMYLKQDEETIAFEDLMNMSYDEMKAYADLDVFIAAIMDAANEHFQQQDAQTVVTLVGEDDVFVWSVLIGPGDVDDEFKYALIDWKKDGRSYRYEKD